MFMAKYKARKEKLRVVFGVLGDPSRFSILELIARKKDFCVSEMASALKISVPAASQQFRILEMAGLVERERMGQKICYKVKRDDSVVRSILKLIN